MVMTEDRLRYDVDEEPPVHLAFVLACTHVLLIFDAIIFVPNILGKVSDVPHETLRFATFGIILIAALFTFLQSRHTYRFGAGAILFTGSYSAFLACSIDAVNMGGMGLLATMSILSVPIVFLYTYFIRFFRHIITPAVGGVVILLIAVSLIPLAVDLWTGEAGLPRSVISSRFMVGGLTVAVLVGLMLFGRGAIRMWSPLIGVASGYVAAASVGLLELNHSAHAPWIGLPEFAWPGLEMGFSGYHVPLFLAFCMAMLASVIENTGNLMLVQQVSLRDFRRVSYDRIQGGLYCDGVSKVAAALFGTAVPSIYCDNIPLIEMTGVSSARVGRFGAMILLCLAFMPKVSGFVLDMPAPVIGGFLLVIAALLFQAGLGLVTMNSFGTQNGLILGISLTVGLVAESGNIFPEIVPASLAPMLQNSVAIGGFTAFILSTLAYIAPKKRLQGVFAAHAESFHDLRDMIDNGREKLGISEEKKFSLMLCCEEMFFYMVGKGENNERLLNIRITRTEEGIFTEAICGHQMDDINNFAMPDSLFRAGPEELDNLGLILFSKYAREVKHMEISGYSYISFFV
jgi:NCS2 family nucleobase:cation symporter-2/xanthine permease XanP